MKPAAMITIPLKDAEDDEIPDMAIGDTVACATPEVDEAEVIIAEAAWGARR